MMMYRGIILCEFSERVSNVYTCVCITFIISHECWFSYFATIRKLQASQTYKLPQLTNFSCYWATPKCDIRKSECTSNIY